ncbi:MAG TPA: glycogen debranching N-terminal domain-containing protein [Acidimicrobiales bacterium]|nr:glycogen debranching N-terminal domain-containing protein [Acidimicrobiales bacterium]
MSAQPVAPVALSSDALTVVNGSTFCISAQSGDMSPQLAHGLFYSDTRIVSEWQLSVGGVPPQVLAVTTDDPSKARIIARVVRPEQANELLLQRDRVVGSGMREDLTLRNLTAEPVTTSVSLAVGADFAGLFSVKDGRPAPNGSVSTHADGRSIIIGWSHAGAARSVRVSADDGSASNDELNFTVTVPPRGEWHTSVFVTPSIDGQEMPAASTAEQQDLQSPVPKWRGSSVRFDSSNPSLQRALQTTQKDLGSLRIFDPDHPDEVAVAAGAPWFMALFGRDSLLSSYMAMPLDPLLALGTLRALARVQGTKTDEASEEQPGRIVHEIRRGLDFPLAAEGGRAYYGSADATPLFVVVLGELRRWGLASPEGGALLAHADRALEWIREYGDRDGDGFVEYQRMTSHGLVNQGWKDSVDGINFAHGGVAEPPIALCEVQGYVYAAYLARAELAAADGDAATAARYADAAGALRRAFNEHFWLEDKGWFAVGLDRDKRPIDALASNMGHCLWSGIVDDDKAPLVAERLMSPQMFSGWGIRTLATSMGAYNPMSYHNGSVWPHDSALIAAGLMRYGFVAEAQRVSTALLDAAAHFDGRLPELICGFDRDDYGVPVAYPTSCSPQAWASAVPVQLVTTLLRMQPAVAEGYVRLDPVWPEALGRLTIRHMALGEGSVDLYVDHEHAELMSLPPGLSVRHDVMGAGHRSPLVAEGPAW